MQGAGAGGAGGGSGGGDSELVSRTLQLEQKLYYLDLKDNTRGRFLKISERTNSNRSTIIVPLNGIVWFVDLFNYYANGDDAELSSKELQLETKVFYFDVGENPRGRFLKVSEAQVPRSTFNRSSIIVPAGSNRDEGWAAFRNALVEIHEASLALPPHPAMQAGAALGAVAGPGAGVPLAPGVAGGGAAAAGAPGIPQGGVGQAFHPDGAVGAGAVDQSGAGAVGAQLGGLSIGGAGAAGNGALAGAGSTAASRVIRAEQKRFFLDLGSNNRGSFLKISEVLGSVRSAIILPGSALEELHESLGQFIDLLKKQGGLQSSGASHVHVRSIPSLPTKAADGEAVPS